jgi:hypothetical protein
MTLRIVQIYVRHFLYGEPLLQEHEEETAEFHG